MLLGQLMRPMDCAPKHLPRPLEDEEAAELWRRLAQERLALELLLGMGEVRREKGAELEAKRAAGAGAAAKA